MSEKNYFEVACERLIADVEKKIGYPLKDSQKQGIWNSGSLMFFEVIADDFYSATTPEALEKWLKDIDGFTRNTKK